MAYKNVDNIIIENAHINFQKFQRRGIEIQSCRSRNFCVIIEDSDMAQKLIEDGWNVRGSLPSRRGTVRASSLYSGCGKLRQYPAQSCYDYQTGTDELLLDEESIATLDFAEIRNVDFGDSPLQLGSQWQDWR